MSWHFLVLRKQSSRQKLALQGGFGLVELMVSISVMVIVSAVILVKQGTFNGAVLLRSQAYEIALALRETQMSAISASGDQGTFRPRYGMYFNANVDNNSTYQVFSDNDGDGFYDAGSEAVGQRGVIDSRFEIGSLLYVEAGSDNDVPEGILTVIFERPNFDARFYSADYELIDASSIKLNVIRRGADGESCSGGEARTLEVTKTGQIAVLDC